MDESGKARRERRSFWGYSALDILTHLWEALPAEREALRIYVDRAKSYRNDCGCVLGGVFFLLALCALLTYGILYHQFNVEHWLAKAAWLIGFPLSAVLFGKMIGIGIARFRLILLGQEVRRRYPMGGK